MSNRLSGGVRAKGRADVAAATLRRDGWWRYPVATFTVLFCFIVYATYAALATGTTTPTPTCPRSA